MACFCFHLKLSLTPLRLGLDLSLASPVLLFDKSSLDYSTALDLQGLDLSTPDL